MRFNRLAAAVTGILSLGIATESVSAQSATQTVTFSVVSTSRAEVSGTARPIFVRSDARGRVQSGASGGTSLAITTNESNQKIAASLDQPMPTGVSLAVSVGAPAGAASAGTTNLGTGPTDIVTGISSVSATALPIVYTVRARSDVKVAARTRVVTFTITAGL